MRLDSSTAAGFDTCVCQYHTPLGISSHNIVLIYGHITRALKASNSSYTLAGFTAYLQQVYHGNITAVSVAWGVTSNPLASFADLRIKEGMGNRIFSNQQELVWRQFNNQRVTAHFSWLCSTVKAYYPANLTAQRTFSTEIYTRGCHLFWHLLS
jgi:hypothetical protein